MPLKTLTSRARHIRQVFDTIALTEPAHLPHRPQTHPRQMFR